jgi:hypothetical protein
MQTDRAFGSFARALAGLEVSSRTDGAQRGGDRSGGWPDGAGLERPPVAVLEHSASGAVDAVDYQCPASVDKLWSGRGCGRVIESEVDDLERSSNANSQYDNRYE